VWVNNVQVNRRFANSPDAGNILKHRIIKAINMEHVNTMRIQFAHQCFQVFFFVAEKQRESVTTASPRTARLALAPAPAQGSAIACRRRRVRRDQWRALVEALTSIPSSQGLGSAQPATRSRSTQLPPRLRQLLLEVATRPSARHRPESALREAALRLRDEIVRPNSAGDPSPTNVTLHFSPAVASSVGVWYLARGAPRSGT